MIPPSVQNGIASYVPHSNHVTNPAMRKQLPNINMNTAINVVFGGNVFFFLYVCAYVTGLNLRFDEQQVQQIGAIPFGSKLSCKKVRD